LLDQVAHYLFVVEESVILALGEQVRLEDLVLDHECDAAGLQPLLPRLVDFVFQLGVRRHRAELLENELAEEEHDAHDEAGPDEAALLGPGGSGADLNHVHVLTLNLDYKQGQRGQDEPLAVGVDLRLHVHALVQETLAVFLLVLVGIAFAVEVNPPRHDHASVGQGERKDGAARQRAHADFERLLGLSRGLAQA